MRYPVVLTIAGSDSGGCAGIQADIKTFAALGVFGTTAITALTAQNTQGVRAVQSIAPSLVRQQIEAVMDDFTVDAVKTGMLPTTDIIETVAQLLRQYRPANVIVDPVMVATTGASLADEAVTHPNSPSKGFSLLYPYLTLLTPNVPEAESLSGIRITSESDMEQAASAILSQGCPAVLIKGGHLQGAQSADILFQPNQQPIIFNSQRISTHNLHGTGCTYSAAIAACMAQGHTLQDAIRTAKGYLTAAIIAGSEIRTGQGHGPVNHSSSPLPLRTR